jgi:bacillithiol system protein YtxJ
MNWKELTTEEALKEAVRLSFENKILIFKHSTRCPVSYRVLERLESEWDGKDLQNIDLYFLDLLKYRSLSNKIAKEFKVLHQSPQVLLIDKGECIYADSHNYISFDEIKKNAA